jgi:TPR repeat protein
MKKFNGILMVQYLLCAFLGIFFLAEGAVPLFNYVSNQSLSSRKTFDVYRASAQEGDSFSQYRLGKAYLEGIGTEEDFGKAVKWLFHARQNGSYKAELELSKIRKKVATSSDSNEVMEIILAFQEIANEFHKKYPETKKPDAMQETTGTILLFGEGSEDEALDVLIQEDYLLRAPAQIMLRITYKYGLEDKLEPYDPRILAHYQRVVGDGIPRDQFYVAEMHYYELGVKRNVPYARELLENNPLEDAQELLFAIYYEQGEIELAEEVTKQAADNDYSWGAYNYGVFLKEKGSHKEAVEYFNKTLEIDPEYWEAMLNLGQAYIS